MVIVNQTQADKAFFKIPVAIDIYNGANKVRYQVWAKNKVDTFYFDAPQKPDLVTLMAIKFFFAQKKKTKRLMNTFTSINMPLPMLTEEKQSTLHQKFKLNPKAIDLLKNSNER